MCHSLLASFSSMKRNYLSLFLQAWFNMSIRSAVGDNRQKRYRKCRKFFRSGVGRISFHKYMQLSGYPHWNLHMWWSLGSRWSIFLKQILNDLKQVKRHFAVSIYAHTTQAELFDFNAVATNSFVFHICVFWKTQNNILDSYKSFEIIHSLSVKNK